MLKRSLQLLLVCMLVAALARPEDVLRTGGGVLEAAGVLPYAGAVARFLVGGFSWEGTLVGVLAGLLIVAIVTTSKRDRE